MASYSMFGVLALAAACGGGEESSDPVIVNTASAGATVTQTSQVTASIGSSDGGAAAGGLYALGNSAGAIVTPDYSQARRVGGQRGVTGTCDCSPTGCTFVACGDDTGVWSVDGTIAIAGDTYTFDVEMAYAFGGQSWDWAYAGELTASASLLDGSLGGEGAATLTNPNDGSTIEYDSQWSVDYNEIGLDGSGCPISGSVDATVAYDVSVSGGAGSYSGSGHVDFGPTCGAATGS